MPRKGIESRVEDLEALSGSIDAIYTLPYSTKTATYTITSDDYLINCTSNTFTINLPTGADIDGRSYVIKNTGTGVITIDAYSTQTIDGNRTIDLYQYDSVTIVSDGTNWIII